MSETENVDKTSKFRLEVKIERGMTRTVSWVNNHKDYTYYASAICQETMVQRGSLGHPTFTSNIWFR